MKKIELINADVLAIVDNIGKISVELPAIVSYKIIKNTKLLEPTYKSIVETRNELVKKYAKEGTESIEAGTPEYQNFTEAYFPILNEKTTVELETATIDSLGTINIGLKDMSLLNFMLVDSEE